MRESLRGLLQGVLFFGGLALLAVPATADNMKCKGKKCEDETTVTASNPNAHNYSVPIYLPPISPTPPRPPRPSRPVFGGNNPPPVNGLGVTPFTQEEAEAAGNGVCSFLRSDAANGFRQVLLGGFAIGGAAASYLGTTSLVLPAGAAAVGAATVVYGLCVALGAG